MAINKQSYQAGAQKSSIREIAAFAAQRKAEVGAEHVYDFSLGNPSVPAPAEVAQTIERLAQENPVAIHSYTPANGLPQVRQTLADSLNRKFGEGTATADTLYLTCGAAASVSITLHALCNPGDEVIVIAPYFPEYRVWIEKAQASCVEVLADQTNFHLDLEALAQAVTPHTKAVLIDSPNNPVGTVYSREELEALASVLRAKQDEFGTQIYLISDEPYREITYGYEVPWVPAIYDRTIVAYSYSKALSLPGERIGWILVPPTNPEVDELVPAVAGAGRLLGFVCAPALFQHVLAACVDTPATIEPYEKNRAALCKALDDAGYEYVEPQGAFYLWIKALEPDAQAFCERAKAYDLLPVPSDSFGCTGWVRASYCVSFEVIENSAQAWKQLAESYQA